MVEWEEAWEPANIFEQCPDHWTKIRDDYENEKNRPAHTDIAKHLVDTADDQGWIPPLVIDAAITTIGAPEINPDKDIHPVGEYSLMADPDAKDADGKPLVVNCYDPQGRFLGQLGAQRLHTLYTRYLANVDKPENPPNGNTTAAPPIIPDDNTDTTFPQEIAGLLRRYKSGYREHNKTTKMRNHWATPTPYMEALQKGLSISRERFASPLNFDPNMDTYYSAFSSDSVFGASHDCFSTLWTGASQFNPEYEHMDLNEAMKHAVVSTYTNSPVLSVFVGPAWDGTSYTSWLRHPRVHLLARIPKNELPFIPFDYWKGDVEYNKAHTPKWDVNFVIVANKEGLAQYYKRDEFNDLFRNASNLVGGRHHTPNYPDKIAEDKPLTARELAMLDDKCKIFKIPKKFKRLPCETPPESQDPPGADLPRRPPQVLPETVAPLDIPQLQLYHMRYDSKSYIYTDGSKINTESCPLGAGAYDATNDTSMFFLPEATLTCKTVCRAELVAIYGTLRQKCIDPAPLKILTDSQTSLDLIRKALDFPAAHKLHKHQAILRAIAGYIKQRNDNGLVTSIGKVRAHIGVHGNEMADQAAKAVATGQLADKQMPEGTTTVRLGSEPARGEFWPVTEELDDSGPSATTVRAFAHDIGKDLRRLCHKRCKTHTSNNNSIYVQAWRKTVTEGANTTISNAYMRHASITDAQRKNAKRFQYGVLPNNKSRHRMFPTKYPDSSCPICNHADDGGGHILGNCSHKTFKGMYINRHNEVVKTVHKTLTKGGLGGCYTTVDGGRLDDDGVATSDGRTVPQWMLPFRDSSERVSRPDIMIVQGMAYDSHRRNHPRPQEIQNTLGKQCIVHLVEIGYCYDSKHGEKRVAKRQQHQELVQLLKANGWEKIQYHTIVVGCSGTVFDTDIESTHSLGLTPKQAREMFTKINIGSIQWLDRIVTVRFRMEHEHRKTHGRASGEIT